MQEAAGAAVHEQAPGNLDLDDGHIFPGAGRQPQPVQGQVTPPRLFANAASSSARESLCGPETRLPAKRTSLNSRNVLSPRRILSSSSFVLSNMRRLRTQPPIAAFECLASTLHHPADFPLLRHALEANRIPSGALSLQVRQVTLASSRDSQRVHHGRLAGATPSDQSVEPRTELDPGSPIAPVNRASSISMASTKCSGSVTGLRFVAASNREFSAVHQR